MEASYADERVPDGVERRTSIKKESAFIVYGRPRSKRAFAAAKEQAAKAELRPELELMRKKLQPGLKLHHHEARASQILSKKQSSKNARTVCFRS